jgi:hypothetical protein
MKLIRLIIGAFCIASCGYGGEETLGGGRGPGFPGAQAQRLGKFTPNEDATLRGLVQQFGTSNWQLIAQGLPGRNPRQCRGRWDNYLEPKLTNSAPWTAEDDKKLQRVVLDHGRQWTLIRTHFEQRRSADWLRQRWLALERNAWRESNHTS